MRIFKFFDNLSFANTFWSLPKQRLSENLSSVQTQKQALLSGQAINLETLPENPPRVSILIPCFNEELTIEQCILSCLAQVLTPHEIIVVDDCSTDSTPEILSRYTDRVVVVKTSKNTRNKSSAQEYGLRYVSGEIVAMTDADTMLHPNFLLELAKDFSDPKVAASGGYVKSLKYNWLTRCRALDYVLGQNLHKLAQSYLNFMLVIPGAAGAFRTSMFRDHLTFEHDTVTEDLDFTYKMHKLGFKICYNRKAIVFTQDPSTLYSYVNQMRRWFGGGWQNLLKHSDITLSRPSRALELSLMYIEGLVFSALLFVVPLFSLRFAVTLALPCLAIAILFAVYAAIKERRADLVLAPFPYMFLMYVNSYVFLEQFVKEVLLQKKNLTWFNPQRVQIEQKN